MSETRIVIIGAGYAGVMAANRLSARGREVLLVSPRDAFVERIRLHRVAAGLRDHARVPLDRMLSSRVRLHVGSADRIDTEHREVVLGDGTRLGYDAVILAVGSGAAGAEHTANDEAAAMRTRAALRARPTAPVAVVGAGFTGIELATALATAGRSVTLHARGPLDDVRAGKRIERRLRRLRVTIADANATRPDENAVVVHATGFRIPDLARRSDLPVDAAGRLRVLPDLSVPGHPCVFGAGDAIALADTGLTHLRPACATALPTGAHVADVVDARLDGKERAEPFSLGYVATCIDTGGGHGRFQVVTAHDRGTRVAWSGLLGGLAKETINRLTLRWLRRAGTYRWRRDG